MDTGTSGEQESMQTAAGAPTPTTRRRRWFIGAGALVALLAVVVFAGAALAAPPRFPRIGGPGGGPANGGNTMNAGAGGGIEAVVTGVDTGANTITLAGLPTQISTVAVNNNVKLVRIQPDGTTQPAAIGDFTNGSVVRVSIGRGNGNNNGNNGNNGNNSNNGNAQGTPGAGQGNAQGTPGAGQGNAQGTPGAGRRGFNIAVTQLALVPDNTANVSGLVIASNNGTYTIAAAGNLRLTIKTQGNTTYNTNRNGAATAADVKVGTRISVSGTQAPDGITANSIHITDLSNLPQRGNGNGGNGNGGNGNGGNGNGNGPMPGGRMPGGNNAPTATATA